MEIEDEYIAVLLPVLRGEKTHPDATVGAWEPMLKDDGKLTGYINPGEHPDDRVPYMMRSATIDGGGQYVTVTETTDPTTMPEVEGVPLDEDDARKWLVWAKLGCS